MRALFIMSVIMGMVPQAQSLAASGDNHWLPLTRSEIIELTVGASDMGALKIETSDVQKTKMTEFLPADDTIWTVSSASTPLMIVMAGRDQGVDSLRIDVPVVNYSTLQSDRVFALLMAFFKRLYPEWAGAPDWPRESLLEAWSKGQIIRKEINGITNATFGVPPDVVIYTITTRDQCVPDVKRGNPFQRPIC